MEEERKEKVSTLKDLENDLVLLESGIAAADNAISQGNEEIGKEVKKNKPNVEKMRIAQAQISMGVKRKIELQEDISAMKKKIAIAEKEL